MCIAESLLVSSYYDDKCSAKQSICDVRQFANKTIVDSICKNKRYYTFICKLILDVICINKTNKNKKRNTILNFIDKTQNIIFFTCNKNLDFIVLLWLNFQCTHMWLVCPSTLIVITLRIRYLGLGA